MDNYVMIGGKRIELTEEQAARILAENETKCEEICLADLAVGDTFRIGECEFLVLEQTGEATTVIKKALLVADMEFGENNNYAESQIRSTCEEFAEEIAKVVGPENILEHTVDLTSDDGLKDYGTIKSRCSLLTADLYRRYVEILDKFKPDSWWWLATAHSTKRHENDNWGKCVSPSGFVDNIYCGDVSGVRPFCILKSTIFVSK